MGKKKKSMTNKLSRMSDEERARYLQLRTEIEEEAKKRREQLIETFLKNKIKKEDAFSRLNLAKINQFWHQTLRKYKCKEMKDNVENMKDWLQFLVSLKDKTLKLLIEELDDAEEQYSYNFKTHLTHIDDFMGFYNSVLTKLQRQYGEDLDEMLNYAAIERVKMENRNIENMEHLKGILFGQNSIACKILRQEYEYYMQRNYEMMKTMEASLKEMISGKEKVSAAIWQEIADLIRSYVEQTDTRRHHLAELKRLDAESATEILFHQERITKYENLIRNLNHKYKNLEEESDIHIKHLERTSKSTSADVFCLRKKLHASLDFDKRKIRFLTNESSVCLSSLDEILRKGEHMMFILQACQKFETNIEKLNRYLSVSLGKTYPFVDSASSGSSDPDTSRGETTMPKQNLYISPGPESFMKADLQHTSGEEHATVNGVNVSAIMKKVFLKSSKLKSTVPSIQTKKRSGRPYTSRKTPPPSKSLKSADSFITTPASRFGPLSRIVIQAKESNPSSASSTSSETTSLEENNPSKFIECYNSLQKLENFWLVFNNAKVSSRELQEEKKVLIDENKRLREMLRAVLEAAALARSVAGSTVSTRPTTTANVRSVASAPVLRTIIL